MSIDKIVNFEGKRNCSITLLLKVNDRYSSTLDQIERKISSIKHENKRKQLKNVIYRIKNETKDLYNNYDFKERGLIICCGLKSLTGGEQLHSTRGRDRAKYTLCIRPAEYSAPQNDYTHQRFVF